jgi:NAD(P)-dependent dehydrogenase (short-subunit alcohol dehydrogenase family)
MTLALQGRRAVVTGAGAIGRRMVERLGAEGVRVAVWDSSPEVLGGLARGASSTHVVDVTSPADVARAAAETLEGLGGVDILVTTAAVASVSTVADMEPAEWRRVLDVNLTGVFLTCQAFVRGMVEAGSGSIVNVSSIGGLRGEPEFSHYCASKFGVIGFSQSLAREVGASGVRVNCVAPGAIESPMNTQTMARDARRTGRSVDDVADQIRAKVALGRLGTPDDVADATLYLVSGLAGYVTGRTLSVDGGVF